MPVKSVSLKNPVDYCGFQWTVKATRNNDASKKPLDQFTGLVETSIGAFRIPQFAGKIFKSATEVARLSGGSTSTVQSMGSISSTLGGIANATSFAACFVAVPAAGKSIVGLAHGRVTGTKVLDSINKTADATAYLAYATLLFTSNEPVKVVGDIASVVADGTGVIQKARDLHQAINIKASLAGKKCTNIKKSLGEYIKLKWIELSKEITALATGVLGLLGLMLGGLIVPAIVLLTISLASTVLAITSHFFKANMDLKVTFTQEAIA